MLRTISVMFVLSIYGILPAWAQTDAPEGQPAPIQRGMGRMPPIADQPRQSETPPSPAKPSESSPIRPAAQNAPPVVSGPVPVIPTKEGENGYVRTVCRLANIPANSAATTLIKVFKTEGESVTENVKDKVAIVPEVIGNCLIISGPPAAVDEVRRLVSEIDRPPAMVRLEVQLTEAVSDSDKKTTEKTAEGKILMHAELSTLDNQTAKIQFGRQESHITGVSMSSGGAYNSFTPTNVETVIQFTPRIARQGIVVLQININDSRSSPEEEGVPIFTPKDGQPIRSTNIENLSNQTTLRLQDGQTQTISVMTRNGKARQIAVTAHIIHPGAENSAK
ncbi:MAG: secretin N-terminal domain-containing protein [Thermoguttaceae bacterium]